MFSCNLFKAPQEQNWQGIVDDTVTASKKVHGVNINNNYHETTDIVDSTNYSEQTVQVSIDYRGWISQLEYDIFLLSNQIGELQQEVDLLRREYIECQEIMSLMTINIWEHTELLSMIVAILSNKGIYMETPSLDDTTYLNDTIWY